MKNTIKKIFDKSCFNVTELAKRTNIARGTASKIINSPEYPSFITLSTLISLSTALDVDIEELLPQKSYSASNIELVSLGDTSENKFDNLIFFYLDDSFHSKKSVLKYSANFKLEASSKFSYFVNLLIIYNVLKNFNGDISLSLNTFKKVSKFILLGMGKKNINKLLNSLDNGYLSDFLYFSELSKYINSKNISLEEILNKKDRLVLFDYDASPNGKIEDFNISNFIEDVKDEINKSKNLNIYYKKELLKLKTKNNDISQLIYLEHKFVEMNQSELKLYSSLFSIPTKMIKNVNFTMLNNMKIDRYEEILPLIINTIKSSIDINGSLNEIVIIDRIIETSTATYPISYSFYFNDKKALYLDKSGIEVLNFFD